ncbi:unnamed protein product [Cylicocyclus nassatus]|uniref:Uncharacterized protein n=1 Tax=Cylicocyclus nassatus TaxID=53992 RepID=A0AA36M1G9_CYLNA|nr:unnamed protein product [Cylicocyclus nassatus]
MRIFKFTFLLLTILMILSAVDVAEGNVLKTIGKGLIKVGEAVKNRAVEQVKKIPKAIKQVRQVFEITGALGLP